MITHLFIPRSMCAQFEYYPSLLSYSSMFSMRSMRITKSFPYAAVIRKFGEVENLYPSLFLSSHRSSGSNKMINRYGLSLSVWMVALLIWIGGLW